MAPSRMPITVYQAATELVALSDEIVDLLLVRTIALADELQGAVRSLPPAIAEATGAAGLHARLSLYRSALRAAEGCASLLEQSRCLTGARSRAVVLGGDLARQIVAALSLLAAGCGVADAELGEVPALGPKGSSQTRPTATGAGS